MAPPGKKAEVWLKKERIMEPRHSRRPWYKCSEVRRRMQNYQPADMKKLIGTLYKINRHNQGVNSKELSLSQNRWLEKLLQKYQQHQGDRKNKIDMSDNSASVEESEYMSMTNRSEMMDTANSSVSGSTSSESISDVSNNPVQQMTLAQSIDNTRTLLKKEPVVQIINSCFKAGIEEGKRRARKYVRKVLSFGLNSGYLIVKKPRNEAMQNSAAILGSRKADAESRRRRRRARRGEDIPVNVSRQDLRGERTTWTAKSKTQGGGSSDVISRKKQGRKTKSRSPRMNSNPRGSRPEKTTTSSGRKDVSSKRRKIVAKKQLRQKYQEQPSRGETPRSIERNNRSRSHRNRISETRDGSVKPVGNETNQRSPTNERKSSSRNKSVSQYREKEARRNNDDEEQLETLEGGDSECNTSCQIITNDD